MKYVWYISIITGTLIVLIMSACRHATLKLPVLPTVEEYRSWPQSTEILLNYQIPGHGDTYRKIYINAIGNAVEEQTLNNRISYVYQPGTVIVKEIYAGVDTPAAEEAPAKLTIMVKAPEHPQALNGWLWLDTDFPPAQPRVITHRMCVDCHANANETHRYGDMNLQNEFRDFVFFPPGKHQISKPVNRPGIYEYHDE